MSTTTRDRKAFYAVAGAADVAVSTLRELPERVTEAVTDEKLRTEIRGRFAEIPAEAKALRDEIPAFVKDVPGKAGELQARLRDLVDRATAEATKTFDELATRGEGVVARLRKGEAADNVVAIRGRVADAADDVADAAGKVADELGETATKVRKPAAKTRRPAPKKRTPKA
jgi:hypothetical protein